VPNPDEDILDDIFCGFDTPDKPRGESNQGRGKRSEQMFKGLDVAGPDLVNQRDSISAILHDY
jgi:hypothetical protein